MSHAKDNMQAQQRQANRITPSYKAKILSAACSETVTI